jgi:tetratricopeptide (TPR) repeat protein
MRRKRLYDKATEISPQNYEAWWEKGQFLSNTGDINESMKAYDRAIELIPINGTALLTVGSWMDKSEKLAAAGRWEDALAAQEKVLELAPKNRVGWTFKAFILNNLGRDNEALDAYNKAIETGPNWDTAWQGRGEAQKAMGQAYNASMSFLVADKLEYKG